MDFTETLDRGSPKSKSVVINCFFYEELKSFGVIESYSKEKGVPVTQIVFFSF